MLDPTSRMANVLVCIISVNTRIVRRVEGFPELARQLWAAMRPAAEEGHRQPEETGRSAIAGSSKAAVLDAKQRGGAYGRAL